MSPRLRVLWLNFSSLFVALFIICSFSFCLSPPTLFLGSFPGGSDGRVCLQCGRPRFDPWVGKISCRRKWQPTPVFLPGKFHEREPGYSPWGHKESDTTEQLTHTLASWITRIPWDAPTLPLEKELNRHFCQKDIDMANRYLKICSVSFVTKIMKIKTIISPYPFQKGCHQEGKRLPLLARTCNNMKWPW